MINKNLILGTVQFGLKYGINNIDEVPDNLLLSQILDYSYKNGVRILDTAEGYGNCQKRIGKYHLESENKFEIISKFNPKLNNDFTHNLNATLSILNIKQLYSYLFHSFSFLENYYELLKPDIEKSIKENRIKKLGVSIYSNDEFEKAIDYNLVKLIQIPFNLFDNINKKKLLIDKAKKKGIEIHCRSVYLQGLFFLSPENKIFNTKLKPLLNHLKEIHKTSKKHNISISKLAINYHKTVKNIDNIIVGVDNINQLKSNISDLNWEIDNNIYNEINKINILEEELLNPSNWYDEK